MTNLIIKALRALEIKVVLSTLSRLHGHAGSHYTHLFISGPGAFDYGSTTDLYNWTGTFIGTYDCYTGKSELV